jgi:glutamate/tyrosine decarboxylase-like PLP-dependent enzyme
MSPEEFRTAGHRLVDRIAEFLSTQRERRVGPGLRPDEIRARLGGGGLPRTGEPVEKLLEEASELVFANSVLPGHPRFLAYVVGAPAPLGALADLLAAAVNQNVGAWHLAPMASEIEAQSVRWIAELIGFPAGGGGLLTSGGNVANFIGFLAARAAKAPWPIRAAGAAPPGAPPLRLYASEETHTWIHKAADLFGLGTDSIRWVRTDDELRIDVGALEKLLAEDRAAGRLPFLVVGSGGTVSTGAVDDLPRLADLCRREGLWFHVDAAYGGFAAGVEGAPKELEGIALADSVAVDPHKWMYVPLEAGCTLVRDHARLRAAFEYRPPYYPPADGTEETFDFHGLGLQNSRGFRALKVWLALRRCGSEGYRRMIARDIALARRLFDAAVRHPEFEAVTVNLSITTFRFVPRDLTGEPGRDEAYLDRLNTELVERLQQDGEVYPSHAVVRGRSVLRTCIVNFRTSEEDVDAVPDVVVRAGRELDREFRPGQG